MKKLFSLMFVAGLLFTSVAFAEEVATKEVAFAINPVVNVATFEDADTTTGVGLEGSVSNLLVDNTVVATGLGIYDLGTADLYRFPVTVGYAIQANETVTITPKAGLVIDSLDADNADTNTEVGFIVGSSVAFKVTETLNLTTGVAYVVSDVEEVELDGFTFTGGLNYRF